MIMKKIFTLLVVMLAFGFSANAQEKSVRPVQRTALTAEKQESIKQAAIKDADALARVVSFTGTTKKDDYVRLFETKHRMYAQDLSDERKAQVAQSIEMKLKASLTADEIQKIETTPGLMKRLTGQQ